MKKKCPSCNSCLDMVWMLPRRFYHCWFEDVWYDTNDTGIFIINIYEQTGLTKQAVDKIMESYE